MWRGNVEVKRRTLDLPEGEAVVVMFDEALQKNDEGIVQKKDEGIVLR